MKYSMLESAECDTAQENSQARLSQQAKQQGSTRVHFIQQHDLEKEGSSVCRSERTRVA
jgi:hypothetical protein